MEELSVVHLTRSVPVISLLEISEHSSLSDTVLSSPVGQVGIPEVAIKEETILKSTRSETCIAERLKLSVRSIGLPLVTNAAAKVTIDV